MSTKHTPGPWFVMGQHQDEVWAPDSHAEGCYEHIATTTDCGSLELEKANARLIAAAPDLLQALVNLVQAIQPGENGQICLSDVEFVETEARGVIYKATGEEA